jgi:hypothetical protein
MTQSLTECILLLYCICCRLMLISVVVLIDVLYAVAYLVSPCYVNLATTLSE